MDKMPVVFFDVVTSFREFPVEELGWEGEWWIIDLSPEREGEIHGLRFGEPPEAPTHRATRKLMHERFPGHAEVLIRANDGGFVAWMPTERMDELYQKVLELEPPCLARSEMGFLRLSGGQS